MTYTHHYFLNSSICNILLKSCFFFVFFFLFFLKIISFRFIILLLLFQILKSIIGLDFTSARFILTVVFWCICQTFFLIFQNAQFGYCYHMRINCITNFKINCSKATYFPSLCPYSNTLLYDWLPSFTNILGGLCFNSFTTSWIKPIFY